MPNPTAILLDFDGVMVNSAPLHEQGWQFACHKILDVSSIDTDSLHGKAGQQIAEELIALHKPQESSSQLWRKLYRCKTQYVIEHFSEIDFYPEIFDALHWMEEQHIPYGIGTNARRPFVDSMLTKASLTHIPYICFEDVVEAKPAAEPFIKLCHLLRASADKRAIVFDDSPVGLKAGVAAGLTVVGVNSQFNEATLLSQGAQYCVPAVSRANLIELFAKI